MMQKKFPRGTADQAAVAHISALLQRYPELEPEEVDDIVHFLRTAPFIDQGLLSARPGMGDLVTRFRKEQWRRFGPDRSATIITIAICVLIATFCVVLLDAGV